MPSQIAADIEVRKNITFATHDGYKLEGDLYRPAGKGPFPVLVALHGGGWVRGARSQFNTWGPYLAQKGYAIFSATYRPAGKTKFPGQVHDIRAAVQFVRGRAEEFGLDAERVGLFGASAGAHLSALAAMALEAPVYSPTFDGDEHASVSAKVKVLIGFYGVYDLLEAWRHYQIQSPRDNNVVALLGVSPAEDRKIYFDASPISYATVANKDLAVFLSVGTEDDFVLRETQTDAFLLALKQAGIFVRTCVVPGAPHYYVTDPIDEPGGFGAYIAPRLLRFLGERL